MKTNKINIAFCVFLIISILFVSISPYFLLSQLNTYHSFGVADKQDGVFLELWNIDTFEGGTNSRAKFLENCAISFENKNMRKYIVVRNLTKDELVSMLEKDSLPDLISFGVGVGETIRNYCKEIKPNSNFKNDILKSGEYKSKQLSVPWCMGGYVLCGTKTKNSVVGVGVENNIPPQVDLNKKIYQKQYDAYNSFLKNEFDVLLGTQRDYFRISNKLTLGALSSCEFEYVNTYTDLLQHIAICSDDKQNQEIAQDFIDYLTSQNCQQQLKNIGMFSVCDKPIYLNTVYQEFEQALLCVKSYGNVFIDDAKRLDLQQKY